VLQPFLSAIAWAAILVATSGRSSLDGEPRRPAAIAATMMTLLSHVVVAPFVIVGSTLAENADRLGEFRARRDRAGPPEPPAWLGKIPIIGERASAYWSSLAHDTAGCSMNCGDSSSRCDVRIWCGRRCRRGIAAAHAVVLIAFFFYRDGEAIMARVRAAVMRISPTRGEHMLDVARETTRAWSTASWAPRSRKAC
jgi:predicted PurR-regulated permease PerM